MLKLTHSSQLKAFAPCILYQQHSYVSTLSHNVVATSYYETYFELSLIGLTYASPLYVKPLGLVSYQLDILRVH